MGGNPVIRTLVRAAALCAGAALTLSALATPSYADGYVPDGCAGSAAYACTGTATPPPTPWSPYDRTSHGTLPVTVTAPSVRVLPSTTVGGQQIGGVVVLVGGQTLPGVTYEAGGDTDPVYTGVVTPVNVCVIVTCILAGSEVVVPGLPLPVVPVIVPETSVPAQPVTVPEIGTLPTQTTPQIATPAVGQHLVTVSAYTQWGELWWGAYDLCQAGGGGLDSTDVERVTIYSCSGGITAAPATALFVLAVAMRTAQGH